MARKDKRWEDDDGRTLFDMSGLDHPGARYNDLIPRSRPKRAPEPEEESKKPDRPWEADKDLLSPEDRRMYVFAALRATLLIGLAFLVGLGLFIWALTALWS